MLIGIKVNIDGLKRANGSNSVPQTGESSIGGKPQESAQNHRNDPTITN